MTDRGMWRKRCLAAERKLDEVERSRSYWRSKAKKTEENYMQAYEYGRDARATAEAYNEILHELAEVYLNGPNAASGASPSEDAKALVQRWVDNHGAIQTRKISAFLDDVKDTILRQFGIRPDGDDEE